MDEVRAKKRLIEITIAKSPLDYITGKKSKRGEELRQWSKSVADKLKKKEKLRLRGQKVEPGIVKI